MNKITLLLALTLLVACATDPDEKNSEALKNDAIDDFIKVAELEPVDSIRATGALGHDVITRDYIWVKDRRNTWLVAFAQTCHDIDGTRVTPDIRREAGVIRARFDTIRGCRIRNIYEVSEGMIEEVESLTRPYEKN